MRKILLNAEDASAMVSNWLPMLIHGEEGSGASSYTICIAAQLSLQNNILFLCGYSMAEEAFEKEVGSNYKKVGFYTLDKVAEFFPRLQSISTSDVVIVKNIELFGENVLDAVSGVNKLIISGDLNHSDYKSKIMKHEFKRKVLFSALEEMQTPKLEKYSGAFISDSFIGVTKLAVT